MSRLRAAGCVFAEEEARLLVAAARTPDDLGALVDRRVAGEPLEHVLGWAEFCGLRIAVDPGVFVPRHRTEFLVQQAVALAHGAVRPTRGRAGLPTGQESHFTVPTGQERGFPEPREPVVVDLCCGSGAVGAALVAALDGVELHAVDVDPAAVRCARRNLAAAGARVYQGDLDAPLPATLRGRVDVLAANTPYVPTAAIGLLPPEARTHEPRVALDGGADGLEVARRVFAIALGWLAPGGSVLVETSEQQAPHAAETLRQHGLLPRIAASEEMDATVVIGTRPRS